MAARHNQQLKDANLNNIVNKVLAKWNFQTNCYLSPLV